MLSDSDGPKWPASSLYLSKILRRHIVPHFLRFPHSPLLRFEERGEEEKKKQHLNARMIKTEEELRKN